MDPAPEPSTQVEEDARAAAALAAAAEAAARRVEAQGKGNPWREQVQEREKRQAFRRLIDPGIVRPNSKELTSLAFETLLKLADNLLREPDNPQYQSFKPTNEAIKKRIINIPGALEYAIGLGFRAEIRDFQPYYTFNPRLMSDLRIGTEIIREAVEADRAKTQRQEKAKKAEKAAAAAAKQNVHLAFLDDRQNKELRDARERQLRAVRAATAGRQGSQPPEVPSSPPSSPPSMPGGGHRLVDPDEEPEVDD